MTLAEARDIFGHHFIGPEELETLGDRLPVARTKAAPLPWTIEALKAKAKTHLLLHCPSSFISGMPITLHSMRAHFGTDPAANEPCFYNQDWYLKDDFAHIPLSGGWHLMCVAALENTRARQPDEIEGMLAQHEALPAAVTSAFAFFANWLNTDGECLWRHDFIWCRDRDHQGDRIYVGRYEDPAGVNKNGFSIHRHLSLRPCYSAAPEVRGG